jgi:hypothetical protein
VPFCTKRTKDHLLIKSGIKGSQSHREECKWKTSERREEEVVDKSKILHLHVSCIDPLQHRPRSSLPPRSSLALPLSLLGDLSITHPTPYRRSFCCCSLFYLPLLPSQCHLPGNSRACCYPSCSPLAASMEATAPTLPRPRGGSSTSPSLSRTSPGSRPRRRRSSPRCRRR